LKLKNKKKRSL